MTLTRQTTSLRAFAAQAEEHEHALRDLLACDAPPELDRIREVTRATRALRGSASLIGLDAFQAFLGRLFALLEDVESSELPWSARLVAVLGEALEAESAYVEALAQGEAASHWHGVGSARPKERPGEHVDTRSRAEEVPSQGGRRYSLPLQALPDWLSTRDLESLSLLGAPG